ncbi:MAG TPA: hypothetical protein PKA58_35030 [Polyangium sp.]|nr:hypothetical protein [Polyangium sp.]
MSRTLHCKAGESKRKDIVIQNLDARKLTGMERRLGFSRAPP